MRRNKLHLAWTTLGIGVCLLIVNRSFGAQVLEAPNALMGDALVRSSVSTTNGWTQVQPTGGRLHETAVGNIPIELLTNVIAMIVDAEGLPVEGAVVVSSAGGKTVSDRDGLARLEITVDGAAEAVHITAVAVTNGVTLVGSTLATLNHRDIHSILLSADADCEPEWLPTFGAQPGMDHVVFAMTVFDDGTGPALYVAGYFTTAVGVAANRIARWDGSSWSPLGSGINGIVRALAVHDDGLGGGPALYAAGFFTSAGGVSTGRIAKWDGGNWSTVGSGITDTQIDAGVHTLAVFDDGSGTGPALYAGGNFVRAGGIIVNNIAKWDGTTWSALGTGTNAPVEALAAFDDGSGPALYAGGWFTTAGGVVVNYIGEWDGTSWSSLAGGLGSRVYALTVFDDGSGRGPSLCAGGDFVNAGSVVANRVAKWDGTVWSSFDSGVNHRVYTLTVLDDGLGALPTLYAGGWFTSTGAPSAGGAELNHITRWDGVQWQPVGIGTDAVVYALASFLDSRSNKPTVYVGGTFATAGGIPAEYIAMIRGWGQWQSLSDGLNDSVNALAVFDDGGGPALFAGGSFTTAGGEFHERIVKWDGTGWEPLDSGVNNPVHDLTVFDDGSGNGPALYAGGLFSNVGGPFGRIAKWDGATWSSLAMGVGGGTVRAMAVSEDNLGAGGGPVLFVGGSFTFASGAVNRIAKWDGTSWSPLGAGVNSDVYALAVFDDGSGPALYAGGTFTIAGGVPSSRIAKWDGQTWSPIGNFSHIVTSLSVFDDRLGGGPALYVGGNFTSIVGMPANRIAKWDGTTWSPLGSGMNSFVDSLAVFDDGTGGGAALYAGGSFTTAGGIAANRIAKWDGKSWSSIGSGMDFRVYALTVFHDGSGAEPALYAGGDFAVSPAGDSFLARMVGCSVEPTEYSIHFDIRPGSCPNPLNPQSNGVLPTAILGTADFDVSQVDYATIALSRTDGIGGFVSPLDGPPGPGIKIEDVAAPFEGNTCECSGLGPDGWNDLTLKFNVSQLVAALELDNHSSSTMIELRIDGQLIDGTTFSGTDCIVLVGIRDLQHLLDDWGRKVQPDHHCSDLNDDGVVDERDVLILLEWLQSDDP